MSSTVLPNRGPAQGKSAAGDRDAASALSNRRGVEESDADVAEQFSQYAYVLASDPGPLSPADEWWNEETYKRRMRTGSAKAFAWLLPFMPLDVIKLPQLQSAYEWGPSGVGAIVTDLRSLVRERRKAKEPQEDLLRALYGCCVANELVRALLFYGFQPHYMVHFVDINDVRDVVPDYTTLGYQRIESLTKTDIKWLVEAFGEPAAHQSADVLWPDISRNAIARFCWQEWRSTSSTAESLGQGQQSMQDWLSEMIRMSIADHKMSTERDEERKRSLADKKAIRDAAFAATTAPFVVADLETTGLHVDSDEVLEIAALRVAPDGKVIDEFRALVSVSEVPPEIASLTGITKAMVDRDGRPLAVVMKDFARFVAGHAIFFHNAPFDHGFLRRASVQTQVTLLNQVHDTLPIARHAWPSLGTYRLATLAAHVGAPAPSHRALEDARAALAVLLAARIKVGANG